MLFSDITVIDENFSAKRHMYLGTKGNRIVYLSDKMPEKKEEYGEEYKGNGKIISPAFCSAHTHAPMTLARGYGENESLMDWLNKKIFPFEALQKPQDIYYSTLLAAAEAFRFGIASVSEMYFFGEAMAKAFIESGLKSNCSICLFNFGTGHLRELPVYNETEELIKNYDGAADGKFIVDCNVHSEYTTNELTVREVAEYCKEKKKIIQLHLSESESEVIACRERHNGMSPVEYMNACGVFDSKAVAAHCVHLSEGDIAILKEKNVTVASCPKSNLKLSSGIAPINRLLKAGVNVAVGTDGVASNNNLNMLEEIKILNYLQKYIEKDASVITPEQTLYMGTRAGYLGQGRTDCGLIKEGYKADLTVFDATEPYYTPFENIVGNLVYAGCGNDVCLTMCDGKVVYRDNEYPTIDLERIKFEVEKSRARISSEL